MKHVIVVGSGIAGLVAALELSKSYAVTIVTKAKLTESNTRYAQGGIAVAMFSDDSVEEHIDDTLRAGAGLCDEEAVRILCTEGPARIKDLIAIGVGFDQRDGELARGMEAAHSHARVLHAGGDATGLSIEVALVRAVRATGMRVMEDTFARELVIEGGRVVGLEVAGGERLTADAVVLASGGAGQLYPHTTNPFVATGDGVAMAFRAGARLADVEFYQFHPTALAVPGSFLVSEAVRGDGATLLNAAGERFMFAIDERGELAPRDVVARGIAAEMERQPGVPVRLDATAMGAEFLAKRFPTIDAACRARGLDWAREPIPVTPAAHYWMGGVQTDTWGRTSVAGLFAVGEVACTGVHGANRLASNSLLESAVFAWRAARMLLNEPDAAWPEVVGAMGFVSDAAGDGEMSRGLLQELMWAAAGIRRDAVGLQAAAATLAGAKVSGDDVAALETRNLLTLARVVVAAALCREESRGAHYRDDFTATEESWRRTLVYEVAR